ncbi:MAG TPA: hypothetical protein VH186_00345 [Chloroflexia bacterium]|nr:hypothetical protein [Chloroflexia bacterium]
MKQRASRPFNLAGMNPRAISTNPHEWGCYVFRPYNTRFAIKRV